MIVARIGLRQYPFLKLQIMHTLEKTLRMCETFCLKKIIHFLIHYELN